MLEVAPVVGAKLVLFMLISEIPAPARLLVAEVLVSKQY